MPASLHRLDGRRALALVGLGALAAAAFAPAAAAGFVSDDYVLLRTLRNATGIAWLFERNDIGEAGGAGHFYRPAWLVWNSIVYGLGGASATLFHLANFLLYAVVTVETWLLARRLFGEPVAWAAGIAFAVYPRHGESVAWVSGSTDLTAVALGLGALLALTSRRPLAARLPAVAALTAAAALAKEIAYVLPLLGAIAVLETGRRRRLREWLPVGAMALVVVGVATARTLVIGGVGGYTAYPWTLPRAAAAAASYVVASVSPPQLELLRVEAFLLVPALLLAAAGWRLAVLVRRGDRERLRVIRFGAAWFGISLLPLLNLAVDLNNANGERLMLLASVGFALALAGLLPAVRGARTAAALAVPAALLLALSLHVSLNWLEATRISDRVIAQAVELAPPDGELLLLSAPENYRTAHVFTSGDVSAALELTAGRPSPAFVCTQVVVRRERAGAVEFRPRDDGSFAGRATWDAPFDVPVLAPLGALSDVCSYEADGRSRPLGLALEAIARPLPTDRPRVLAYFDGRDLRRPP